MTLAELKKEERRLFDTYNWRAPNKAKLRHLRQLEEVIAKIDALEPIKKNENK